ncbi:aspartyl protease family protein [Dokdonella sp.]|uniref:aspartyl protease family protein n=1 Tax=Dokdonella sp. TaxID=2291710 RepID=UPI003C52C815
MVPLAADASLQLKTRMNRRAHMLGRFGLILRSALPARFRVPFLFFAAALISQPVLAVEPAPRADVPLLASNLPSPRVEVRFGTDKVAECIVDTGSDVGVINQQLSRGANSLGRTKVIVAGRRPLTMPVVEVRDVAVGAASLNFVRFLVRDSSWSDPAYAMPCVLGGSFLDRFTVDVDFATRRLRLYDRGTRINALIGAHAANDYDLHARVSSGRIMLDVGVDGATTRAFIDTGWWQTSANTELLEVLGIADDDPRIRVDRTVLRSGKNLTTRLLDLGPIRIGNNTIPSVPVDVGDHAASYAERKRGPYLHVGADMLAGYRLLIDVAHRQAVLLPGQHDE